MRAFIAIEIDQAVLQSIFTAMDKLRNRIPGVRWILPANCHLTLKFLGDIDEQRVAPIARALAGGLSPFPRFIINAKRLGVFPDIKRPRVLWIGMESRPLAALAEGVETALAPFGFEGATKDFVPHLTVARWRQFKRAHSDLRDLLEEWRDRDFGAWTVREVVLFQSVLKPDGAIYRRLEAARLGDEAAFA